MLLTVAICLGKKLEKSQARLHFTQSSLLSILFTVGWACGLAMTGLSGIGENVFGALFLLTGAPLGLYVFLIYCLGSPVVRSILRKECYCCLGKNSHKEYGSTQKNLLELKNYPVPYKGNVQAIYGQQDSGGIIHNPTVSQSLPDLTHAEGLQESQQLVTEEKPIDSLEPSECDHDDIDPPDPNEETAL